MTPRVAIVCSGLGQVARGNETWAATVAEGLHKSGGNIILFGSGPRPEARSPYVRVPCLRRDGPLRRFFSWDKAYLYEQISFARNLRRHLQRDRFDIVHAPDPNLAQRLIAHCARQNIALIYKDGLFIGPKWCAKFKHVQALAPYYEELARAENVDTSGWQMIPHAVDTRAFAPISNQRAARVQFFKTSLSPDAKAVLAVGDFSAEGKKRMDWIVEETAKAQSAPDLILAGHASASDHQNLRAAADLKLGRRAHILAGISHSSMPSIYQCADLLAHAALREPFGLALIEAMASGLPVLAHPFPVTNWIVGDGGEMVDMTKPGALAQAVDLILKSPTRREELSRRARARARGAFDKDVILPKYHEWYHELARSQSR